MAEEAVDVKRCVSSFRSSGMVGVCQRCTLTMHRISAYKSVVIQCTTVQDNEGHWRQVDT